MQDCWIRYQYPDLFKLHDQPVNILTFRPGRVCAEARGKVFKGFHHSGLVLDTRHLEVYLHF